MHDRNNAPAESECRTEAQLRQELVRFGKWVHRLGFTPGTSGNLSVRLDRQRLLVTPTGVSKCLLKPADMVIVDLRGRLLEGTRKVTSEIGMHLAVYDQRPDVQAVIHSHPPIATAFACAGRALSEMLCQEAVMTLGIVPLARYATTGTCEVAESLAPYLPAHDAILLANHGAVSYGLTLLEAFQKMETLEHLAQVSLVAHQLGTAQPLTAQQIEQLHLARSKYLHNAAQTNEPDSLPHRTQQHETELFVVESR
ncbi:class II aldolase/adducin family protein [Granulicella tundricola]|uniref:Class II aldolase/adducin family protein n=1 Tax=Granulicella tundricola (strain ATCC BAA-1859 / DSM 23138 / MP5ACTX9) TaxID=1198114 RepID=E8X4F2_GRATM|nr:class II aldolase/adducin family protein [Granulicella tundricola]ADW68279.1 class II aldolase/adducin family protein [Granulicella tundricola MP5ACTX9]